MEIKIQCGCGTKYKFDVQPVNGVMPVRVQCPNCGNDGTLDANQFIARHLPPTAAPSAPLPPPPVPVAPAGLRIAGAPSAATAGAVATAEAPPPLATLPGNGNRTLLQRTTFFIKERVGLLKLVDTYDILDPATAQPIGIAKEEPPVWAQVLRLVVNKGKLPTAINVYEREGQPAVLSIRRGFTFLRSKVHVTGGDGRSLGFFRSKLISIGGGFHVFDHAETQVAEVKGDWKGWNFRFLNKSGREIGTVTKKWAGLGKELFTTADNYIIALTDLTGASQDTSALLLAAGLALDIVYNEAE